MRGTDLPIYEIADRLVEAVRGQTRVILQAPTGSGKSTQVPQILLDRGLVPDGRIVVLQPRRLPARMLAARVAQERGGALGDEVGYQVRFLDRTSRGSRIVYITEGILLRWILGDPALRRVNTLILDEFHERHVEGDIALGYALRLQQMARPDLRILIMSATLDGDALARHLAPCATLASAGRTYPVAVEYLDAPVDESRQPVWETAARELARLSRREAEGHVLVFMPGVYEIGRTVQAIRGLPCAAGMAVLPLHGELPEEDQDRAVAPSDRRKVVVATNVAETSLTIDGVRLVIDSGLARVPRFDPHRGINTLLTEKISRDSADQRAGRAGRTAPGCCLRLWTAAQHRERAAAIAPEIQRVDLSETILTLKTVVAVGAGASGADPLADVRDFPWLDAPEEKSLQRSFRLLADLGALDVRTGEITAVGRRIVSFPVHPRFARMLLVAGETGCLRSAALIAALTSERSLLVRRADEAVKENRERHLEDDIESDFFPLIRAWEFARKHNYNPDECRRLGIHGIAARRVEKVYESVLRIAEEHGFREAERENPDDVRRCILLGFSDQLARKVGQGAARYALVHGRRGTLSRDSRVRRAEMLVAAEIRELEAGRLGIEVILSLCTAVQPEWLRELFPADFGSTRQAVFDEAQKRAVAKESVVFRDLPVETRTAQATEEEAAALLAEEILAGRVVLKNWSHEADQWVERVNLVARGWPDLGLPPFDQEARRGVLRRLCLGSFSAKDVRDLPVLPALKQWVAPALRGQVERLAPERLELSNGRQPKVVYGGERPYIQARIQELYGVGGPLSVAGGRVPVTVHILGPNQRPVQITEDLAGFWKDGYPRVKKELQRKYPKHEWR